MNWIFQLLSKVQQYTYKNTRSNRGTVQAPGPTHSAAGMRCRLVQGATQRPALRKCHGRAVITLRMQQALGLAFGNVG